MRLQTKALYNLLRLNFLQDPRMKCEDWQIENLREVSTWEIYQKLLDLGIPITKKDFLDYASEVESPEELADLFVEKIDQVQDQDKIYLLLFELWRRFLPERQTLSIFCDELDHRIFLYDRGELESDENLQDALASLEELLDENADIGVEPTNAFLSFTEYLANDLESFLYDYISEQMDTGYIFYAQELLDGFYPYMTDLKWFDFLRARLISQENVAEANHILSVILQELNDEPDIDLQIEILRFMVQAGDRELFSALVRRSMPLLETEEDFREILEIVADFYRRLDQEDLEKAIEKIVVKRSHFSLHKELHKEDPDLETFLNILFS